MHFSYSPIIIKLILFSGKFVFRHPTTTSSNIFMEPFTQSVWIALFITILLGSGLLFMSLRISFVVQNTINTNATNSLLTTLGILSQQGFDLHNIILLSTRITIIALMLLSILVYQFYSSYIVGSLLITPPKTINTLTDLINSHLEVGVEDLSYNKDYLDVFNYIHRSHFSNNFLF